MRKKKYFIKVVYDHPDRIFPLHGDPDEFRPWIDHLRGGKPLVVEIGAGTGDFLVEQARMHPEAFFLAVEVKPDRLYKGFQKARELGIENIAFFQADASQLPSYDFPPLETLYLLFSDPWPKDRHQSRRLTSEIFLPIYQSYLSKHGCLILKTDSRPLFDYSVEMLTSNHWNISVRDENVETPENEQTAYEKKFRRQQKPIFYLKANPPRPPG